MIRRLLYRNFQFVFRLSQAGRDRLTPTGGLIFAGMIFSGIFGVDTRQTLAFQIFTLMASMLIVALVTVIIFRGNFRIRRQLPEFGTVGQLLTYRLLIDNLGKRRQSDLLLIDRLDATLPGFDEFITTSDPQDKNRNWFDRVVGYPRLMGLIQKKRGAAIEPAEVEDLAPHGHTELEMELLPVRRGYIDFTASRIARPDPLGLIRAIQTKSNTDSLLILPRLYRVPLIELSGSRKYQHGSLNIASTVGDSQEFLSLRDYQPGDPLKSIHWRSYAKTGHPVVKEFQDEFIVRQGLLLDTFIENKSTAIFEEAVSVAASYSYAFSNHGQESLLDLMFAGSQAYRFTSGRGIGSIESMLEILACVEPCMGKDFSTLNELVLRHTNETSGMICILLDWDEKRRQLVRSLINVGIPVIVFLIAEADNDFDPGPMQAYPQHFITLEPENIQDQFDQLNLSAQL